MDVNKREWHSRLILSNVGEVRVHSGSMTELMIQALRDLKELTPRVDSNGRKEVSLQFANYPLGRDKAELMTERVAEVESMIDWSAGE